jgi:hypothetical protein
MRNGRRIPLTITVDPATHAALTAFGNRSAAIEQLVRRFMTKLTPASKPRKPTAP